MRFDWRDYLVIIEEPKVKGSTRTTRVVRIKALPLADDANYRAGLRLRKGEKLKEVRPA